MSHRSTVLPVALLLLGSSGCAIGNRGELRLSRHISFGQELLDLQKAHEAGALTDEEYEQVKADR